MPIQVLSQEANREASPVARDLYRPRQILCLETKLRSETRRLETKVFAGRKIAVAETQKIRRMRARLDLLYARWVDKY